MKKFFIPLVIVCIGLLGAGLLLSQQNAEDAKFKKFGDTLWDAYFKFFPTQGTMQGFSKYNDRLEDLSEGSSEKFLATIDAFIQELVTKIDRTKMSPDLQVEHEMARDFLDLLVLKLENAVLLLDNPLYYNDIFVNSIRSLILKSPGSPALAARAKLLPGLIKKAKDNLKTPPQEYTQAALKQMPAIIDFYKTEVPAKAGSAPGLQTQLGPVVAALEDYQKYLQNDLLPKSTGNFRLGPDLHKKLIGMTAQGVLPILEEIVPRSKADATNIRNAMGMICLPYYKVMYPDINPDQLAAQKGKDQALTAVIQGVLDKIQADHVDKSELANRISQAAGNIKAFIQQAKLLDLPDENLQIEPMPAYMPGTLLYSLTAPGAWETSGSYTLGVREIPSDWSPEQVTGYLQEHNNSYIDFMTVQRIYPGSFVPLFFTRKDPSVIKRMCANQAVLSGWSVPVEEMLVYAGYANYDLRMHLNQLKLLLKNVIDFQMDINVHEGTYTKEQVTGYMMRSGFMTQAEAERRWNQIVLNPGEMSLTYIGYQEILDLMKDYQKLKGTAFSQKEFLQKILSHGALPIRQLKVKMAQ